jgi:lipopolysaccharide/colanic/teichoic acid biosynthesis glycosyltransferase
MATEEDLMAIFNEIDELSANSTNYQQIYRKSQKNMTFSRIVLFSPLIVFFAIIVKKIIKKNMIFTKNRIKGENTTKPIEKYSKKRTFCVFYTSYIIRLSCTSKP